MRSTVVAATAHSAGPDSEMERCISVNRFGGQTQDCKDFDRNSENDENNCFDLLLGEKNWFSDAKSDAKEVGGRSWHQVGPS